MGILPALAERHITPDEMLHVKPDGTTRYTVPGPTVRAMLGERALNLLRGDIEDVLHTAVRDRVEIRFGASVTAVSQDDAGVQVTLSDGTVESADLLVGADGLHSAVRSLVFGPEEDFRLDLVADGPQQALPRVRGDMGGARGSRPAGQCRLGSTSTRSARPSWTAGAAGGSSCSATPPGASLSSPPRGRSSSD